ncbi:MAG: glycosyltransferase family 39 protein [Chloroflexota bacterium]
MAIDNSKLTIRQNGLFLVLITAVLLLGTFLRFYLLDNQSFWNDEGNSARLSERTIRLIIEGTASDIHPPLYYLLLRGWRELVGETEFALRALSTFAGVLTMVTTVALAKRMALSKTAVLLVGLFVAVHPALIYYSQETRMYSLLGLLGVLSTLMLWVWLKRPSWSAGLTYALLGAAGLYTHYFFPVVLGIQGIFVLLTVVLGLGRKTLPQNRRSTNPVRILLDFGVLVGGMILLYAPWIPIFIIQFGDEPILRPPFLPFVREVAQWLLVGETFTMQVQSLFFLGLVGLLGLAIFQRQWRISILGGTAVIFPILFNYVLGTTDTAFLKFYIVTVPFLALFVGLSSQMPRFGWLFAGLILLWLLPNQWQSLQNMYFSPAYARADYRGMAQRIIDEAHPNAGIILNAPNQWEAFTYYFPDGENVYPLPKGRTHPTEGEIDGELAPIAAQHERLYAIFWGEAQRDPERLVERWLDVNAFKATDEWVGDVRFVTYAIPAEPAAEMKTAVNLSFSNQILLEGYTLNQTQFLSGEIVQVTLFWQAIEPIDKRYKIFLHILNSNGEIVAQRDSEPGGGLALTPGWIPEETVRDNHGVLLPTGIASGPYQIRLGVYDFANPTERLMIQLGSSEQDVFILPDIVVGQ